MSEKKELNQEQLEKVSGGDNSEEVCPHCKQTYWSYDVKVDVANYSVLCPKCGGKVNDLCHG